jgi:HSP20 family protein
MYVTRWSNFDRDFGSAFAALDRMRRQMDNLFLDFDRPGAGRRTGLAEATTWPRTNLYDTGGELVVCAAVPGMSEKDIEINATADVLSISGARAIAAPAGYSIHRQERGAVKFSRSFALPYKVDVEKTSAAVKDGMLTIRLSKSAEAQPRQISVKASS